MQKLVNYDEYSLLLTITFVHSLAVNIALPAD